MAKRQVNDFQSESSSAMVVTVDGKTYAVGLLWNDADHTSSLDAEARQMAARPNVEGDLYLVREHGADQYAIGFTAQGHASGMPSLAAYLADSKAGNWFGVFQLENGQGYYIVAFLDGKVRSNTDKVIQDEFEAKTSLEELYAESDWQFVYAPASFDRDGASDTELTGLFGNGKAPRLKSTSRVGGFIKYILFGGVIVAAGIGAVLYMQWKSGFDIQNTVNTVKTGLNPKQEIQVPPGDWAGELAPSEFLAGCMQGMKKTLIDFPGWVPLDVICTPNKGQRTVLITEEIKRTAEIGKGGGSINWIRWRLDHAGLEKATAASAGNDRVNVSWLSDSGQKTLPDLETTQPLGAAKRFLTSWVEESLIRFETGNEDRTNKFYWSMNFKFTVPFDPTKFNDVLDRVQALLITKVTYQIGKSDYLVEGTVYEARPLPKGAVRLHLGDPVKTSQK